MADLTPTAKEIIAREIIEESSKAFFAYLATQGDDFRKKHNGSIISAFGSFTNEVWGQICEDHQNESKRVRGQ